jgi:hypothetical protein
MVKFSQGDNDLETIIFYLNDFLKERLGRFLLAVNDVSQSASQSQQTLPEENMDNQSVDGGVLTEDDKIFTDLGSILSSIQGNIVLPLYSVYS